MPKEIKAYQAEDGRIFPSLKECEDHERKEKRDKVIFRFIAWYIKNEIIVVDEDRGYSHVFPPEEAQDWILENEVFIVDFITSMKEFKNGQGANNHNRGELDLCPPDKARTS